MNRFLSAAIVALAFDSSGVLAQAASQSTCDPAPARATSVQGTVEVRRVGDTQWRALNLNDALCPGDSIRVQERSRADIQLLDQSVLRLNANSAITVEAPKERTTGVVDLVRGAVHFFSRGPRSLEVKTPYTVAGVRGTEFFIGVDAQRAQLIVYEGTVVADSPAGSLTLKDGEAGVAVANKPPVAQVVARPRDAVHWALYYPPVIDVANAPGYRAQTLLAVGAVDEARSDIGRALQAAPNDANALSLQSIMAVVQGEKDQALQLAQSAVAADPKSATALISRSYAEQARFDLNAARASAQQAVQLEPNNALAWARLAELHSSFGDLDASLAAARRAVEINPNLSRTQTVLGFAHLTSIKTREAKAAFEKAISLDQADPLPRLGLGLALVREGELDRGSRQIEVAASLDPNNALVRSYLGKAYYEEKRTGLDEREYAVAKQLDPKDPTPQFYDAITKQTTNRPVEALQGLESAIELNDNRAVYRSQLLLDSDAAARSASLGNIYSELGFQGLALTEGWKSVNLDPANFSAHRLLADTYSALPRHEIARVSELLQSQLLQPVGLTPIQPRLSQSNLFLISAGGPGALSFNEYNRLFTRNGWNLQASAQAGERNTNGQEIIVSGLKDTFAFSLGGYNFDTDGWRTNSHQEDTIANAFLQKDFSPNTSVQFEYRSRDIDTGDLQMSFFNDSAFNQLTTSQNTDTYRVGFRHGFSTNSIVLASLLYQKDQQHVRDTSDPATVVDITEPDTKAKGAELQHLYRSNRFSVVSGIGYYDLDRKQLTNFVIPDYIGTGDNFTSIDDVDASVKHTNVYLYVYLNVLKNLTVTLGASGDFFKSDGNTVTTTDDPFCIFDTTGLCVPFGGPVATTSTASRSKDQFNPKLGVTWNPVPGTTLRAAAFRAMKRAIIANQTLEPTQVAGFNQFYDDIEATDAKVYGVAVDQKFSRTLFGGLSGSRRELEVPIPFLDPFTSTSQVVEKDWSENLGRAYLFLTPHRSLALSAEFQYERFERTADSLNFGLQEATTKKVPLGVRFFHPSGITLGVKATHIDQDGLFTPKGGSCAPCQAGSSSFWLTDVVLSYRFPKRYGFFSAGATNLADRNFQYQETDFNNPTILPRRMAFARLTLAIP